MSQVYRQLLEAFGRAWQGGDVDAIVAVFSPDAVFLETPFSERSVPCTIRPDLRFQIGLYWAP